MSQNLVCLQFPFPPPYVWYRDVINLRREDHGREATALRKQLAENEARLKVEIDRAEGAAAELRDGNLSLEGVVRALEDKEESLRDDLQAEREERKKVVRQVCTCSSGRACASVCTSKSLGSRVAGLPSRRL